MTALEPLHHQVKTGDIVEGRYRIVRLISEGGMSSVYLAEHVLIKRRVAVKLLREDLVDDSDAVERFMNEASAAGTLGHPNIVESTDMGMTRDGVPFIVFEYLEGATLTEEIYRVGGMSVHRACRIAVQITSALQAAHDSGIVHGDLKTDNIFLCTRDYPDHVKVLDFGASRFQEVEVSQRKIIGTPEFLAPEQILHPEAIDRRVDIYALGLVMYEMLTARRAFANDHGLDELLRRIVHEPPAPLSIGDAPPALSALLGRMLAKHPDDRPGTMLEVEKAITDISGQVRVSGTIPPLSRTIEIKPRAPVPSKTITNLAPPPALAEVPPLRSSSPSSPPPIQTPTSPSTSPPPPPLEETPPAITAEPPAAAAVVSLPAPVPLPSRTWLMLLFVALFAAAAGAATWFVAQEKVSSGASAQSLQLHADKLVSTLEQAISALKLRAESIASSPMLRAAVETDAATLRDMIRDRDFVFEARPGETLELFANKTSLLRIPEKSPRLEAIDHDELRLRGDQLVVHTGVKVGSRGLLVLAAPIDLGPARGGYGPGMSATLAGFEHPIPVHVEPATGATEEHRFPLAVRGDARPKTLLLTVPAPTTTTVASYAGLRVPLFGLAGGALLLSLILLLRRRR